jgi:hypothetical protein
METGVLLAIIFYRSTRMDWCVTPTQNCRKWHKVRRTCFNLDDAFAVAKELRLSKKARRKSKEYVSFLRKFQRIERGKKHHAKREANEWKTRHTEPPHILQ